MLPCTVKGVYPNSRGTRCLPVRSQTVGQPRIAQWQFFVFFSYTEHGGSIFLRNISKLLQEDAASSPSQYYSSQSRPLQPHLIAYTPLTRLRHFMQYYILEHENRTCWWLCILAPVTTSTLSVCSNDNFSVIKQTCLGKTPNESFRTSTKPLTETCSSF